MEGHQRLRQEHGQRFDWKRRSRGEVVRGRHVLDEEPVIGFVGAQIGSWRALALEDVVGHWSEKHRNPKDYQICFCSREL